MTPAGVGLYSGRRSDAHNSYTKWAHYFFFFFRTTISSSAVNCFNCDGEKVLNYVNNSTEKTYGSQVLTEVVKSWPRGIRYFVTVVASHTKLPLQIPSYFYRHQFLFFKKCSGRQTITVSASSMLRVNRIMDIIVFS